MSELGRKVSVAARWSLVNTIVVRVGTFASGVVLARYFLGPHEWGLYAVGAVVLTVLLSANEMGVSLAMIRWEGDVRRFAPTVMTLATASSLILYLTLYLAAPAIAALLGSAQAVPLIRVLCLAVVIDGIACVPNGCITREFKQVTRMVIDFAGFVVSTGLTVGLAAAGFGAMSFAWGATAGSLTALAGAAIVSPRMMRYGWEPATARELLRFGLPLAGSSLLVLAMANVDSMVVGAVLGPTSLGLYQIAANMSGWPVRTISEAARRVSFAGFSRLAESAERLADGYRKAFGLLTAAAVPACALLGTLAEPVIRTVYGAKWVPAAEALTFLAALGVVRIVYELTYDCLIAAGRRKALLALQAWWLVALVPSLILLANGYGIAGVGAGQVAVSVVLVAPAFVYVLARVGIAPRGVAMAGLRPFLGGIVVVAVSWLVYRWVSGLPGILLASFAGLAAYLPFVWPMFRPRRVPRHAMSNRNLVLVGSDHSGES